MSSQPLALSGRGLLRHAPAQGRRSGALHCSQGRTRPSLWPACGRVGSGTSLGRDDLVKGRCPAVPGLGLARSRRQAALLSLQRACLSRQTGEALEKWCSFRAGNSGASLIASFASPVAQRCLPASPDRPLRAAAACKTPCLTGTSVQSCCGLPSSAQPCPCWWRAWPAWQGSCCWATRRWTPSSVRAPLHLPPQPPVCLPP